MPSASWPLDAARDFPNFQGHSFGPTEISKEFFLSSKPSAINTPPSPFPWQAVLWANTLPKKEVK